MSDLKKKILVVEDDPDIAIILMNYVSDMGYTARSCSDGKAALEHLLGGNSYDLVISDISMPKLDGIEFIKSLRDHSDDTPVVILTGYASNQRFRDASKLGCFEILEKPFDPKSLSQAVENALKAGPKMVRDIREQGDLLNKTISFKVNVLDFKKIEELAKHKSVSMQSLMEEWIQKGIKSETKDKAAS